MAEETEQSILQYLKIPEEAACKIVGSTRQFSNAYNRSLESLKALTATHLEVGQDGVWLPDWEAAFRPASGDCVDLALDLLRAWGKEAIVSELEQAGIKIFYCEGTESQFFNSDIDNHAFIGLTRRGSNAIDIVVDPALQQIRQFADSGYSIRTKSADAPHSRLPGREIRFTDLPERDWQVSDFLTSDAAVLGLTANRQFAISLGFARYQKYIFPFLVLAKGKNRGVIYLNFESGQAIYLLSELDESTAPNNWELNALGEALSETRFLLAQE